MGWVVLWRRLMAPLVVLDKQKALARVPSFWQLSPAEIEVLAEIMATKRLKSREVFAREARDLRRM